VWPNLLPSTIRLDFLVGDERRRWEDTWDHEAMRDSSIELASNLGIIHAHMC
jgi:hypothetical protein